MRKVKVINGKNKTEKHGLFFCLPLVAKKATGPFAPYINYYGKKIVARKKPCDFTMNSFFIRQEILFLRHRTLKSKPNEPNSNYLPVPPFPFCFIWPKP